jgi:WD40 repeat protein
MPITTRTFRVFVSSTFEDLKEERDALQRHVFPRLRSLCEQHGARFQAIDLRWGVRDEAALDQRTMEICLAEIERCQRTGIKPNFIVLLGDRYGWQPLPSRIEAREFEAVRDRIADPEDRAVVEGWYQRDDNAVPPEYLLKPRTDEFADKDHWGEVERKLHRVLQEAARDAGLTQEKLLRYEVSATHQEVLKGLGETDEDRKHVFAFFREPAPGIAEDSDLAGLKKYLREKLADGNICSFSASDSTKLCADVNELLSKVILAEAGTFKSRPALDLQIEAHEAFARDRARHFRGRKSVLDAIGSHIGGGESCPLVVHGASGCGKSAIVAKASAQAKEEMPGAVLIQRFIGVTPDSSSGFTLLRSLCEQLSREYAVTEETPMGFQPLVVAFHERMTKATAERPLVLFLDALDQLRSDDEARSFTWLRQTLPPHVSLVVSTTEIPAGLESAAQVAVEDFPVSEAETVLVAWLQDAHHKLQPMQRQKLLSGFAQSGLPLYLKLAFEEARRWRSFDPEESCVLGNDVGDMIDVLFNRLSGEANHGPILVNRSLGYLGAARYGLSEDEMLDVLAEDDVVWSDFDKRKHHEVSERRLPVVVWSRLSLDLEPYFTERAAPGGAVISFFHRQLAERVASKYLEGTEFKARHIDLAQHFSAKPAWLDEGRKAPNARRAAELVFQQRVARQWAEAEATLFDCQFLFAKVAAAMVLDLDDDYQALLQDAPVSELPRRDTLRLIQGTLRISLHVVAKDPGQFASQMRGRLLAHQAKPGIAAFLEDLDVSTPRPRLRPLWPTLEPAGGSLMRILEGHTSHVEAVALSADGKRAVSGSSDGTLRVWDLEGNQPPRVLESHTDGVTAVALSADGRRAVSASNDKTVRVWDLEGNRPPRLLEGHTDWVVAVALSADGRRAVSGSRDSTLRVWDLEGNQPPRILESHTDGVTAVALSADGRRAVSGSRDSTLRVWDLEGNQPPRILEGHADSVWTLALSADGKRAVSGSGGDIFDFGNNTALRVWDLEGNQPPRVLEGHTSGVIGVALSGDGRRAVSGSRDYTVRVWDLEGNQPPRVLEGHTRFVKAVALSADGKRAISGSHDKTLRVWNLEGNQPPRLLEGHTGYSNVVALSADGKRAISRSENYALRVWDLEGDQPPRIMKGHTNYVHAVALSADGKRAVSGSEDFTVRVWDLEGDQPPRIMKDHAGWVYAVALSADGKRAVSGSHDKTLRVWDLEGNQPPRVLKGHTDDVHVVALSADGKRAISGSDDHTVRVWDLKGNQPPRILEGHAEWERVRVVALSGDGKRAISGSRDSTLRVWDLKGNQPPRILGGHTDSVDAMALSGDGKRAVSGSFDKTLRVWDLESGRCLAVFTCDAGITFCAWAGERIVAGDGKGQSHLFAWEE